MGDLKGAPAVHINFPLLSFYLCITSKLGLPLPVSLFLRNKGGLVIARVTCHTKNIIIYLSNFYPFQFELTDFYSMIELTDILYSV